MRALKWALLTSGLLLGGLLTLARTPAAELQFRPIDDFVSPPDAMRVNLEVLVDGQPLATVQDEGKTYLPVPRLETEYQIRVSNHGSRRIAAIVSVDGLSVINGKPASKASPAYLVAPHSSILIKGWRRSLDTVAAFRFVERDKSYASLMGRPENVGVIGLIAVEEEARPLPRLELEKKDSAAPSARTLKGEVGGTGTGYGRDVDSPAEYVPFVRSANERTLTFYYDTVDALRKAGIPIDSHLPVPFPCEFAPPPPGHGNK
jgi:hypothetical protein